MGGELLPRGHLATTAKFTLRALAAMQMGYSDSAGCCLPLLILVLFYIIGAPPFTRLGGRVLYFRLIFEIDLRQPNAPGCFYFLGRQEPRWKGVCRNPLCLQLGTSEETQRPWRCLWPSVREKSALPHRQRYVRNCSFTSLGDPQFNKNIFTCIYKICVFQKPGKGEKLVRLENKWVISPYKRKEKQSLVILSCAGYIN